MTRTILGAVFSALLIAGCGQSGDRLSSVDRLRTEPTSAKVERRDIVGYTLMSGEIYVPPTDEAVIRAPYSGSIEKVMTSVGQRVRRGEVLAQLALPDHEQAYADARGAVQAAEAAYANARQTYYAPVRDAEKMLAQARASERAFRSQTDPMGDASGLEQARASREAAEQAVAQAKAEAENNILPYKQQLDNARAVLKAAQSGVKQGSIDTPISGTVLELGIRSGETVAADSPIARVVDLGAIKVKATVDEADEALVKEGKEVVVTFDGMEDQPFTGRVSKVQVVPATEGVTRIAMIDFKNDDGLVKPGMKVHRVGIKIGEVKDVLAVPAASVYDDASGKPTANVLKDGKWVPTVVETGLSDGDYTQIKDGLKEGDTVQVPGK